MVSDHQGMDKLLCSLLLSYLVSLSLFISCLLPSASTSEPVQATINVDSPLTLLSFCL